MGTEIIRRAVAGRRRAVVLATTGLAAGAAVTALALPAGASPITAGPAVSGTQHFQMMNTSTRQNITTNPLIAYGVITAAGTDHENANGTDTFSFPGGSLTVKHTPTKGATKQSFNVKSCLFTYSEKGTFKVSGGTGKYKGASGSGSYTLSAIGIGPKLKSGACSQSQTAPLTAQQQGVQIAGKIALP
jgi:hypothetical protein